MSINLNADLLESWPASLALVQRALYYGDTLFESIRVFQGRIPLLQAHWKRLENGMRLMGYQVPAVWSADYFEKEIIRVSPPNARVRLTVWRSPGGLYLPDDDTPNFLIAAQALDEGLYEWPVSGLQIGLCDSVRLPVDGVTGLKSLNAARYVVAAREAHAQGWNDGIILNTFDRVCESTRSNVFWWEGDTLCTPPLAEGCLTGVLRDLLLYLTLAQHIPVAQKAATFADLLAADEVFLTNAIRGIQWVHVCEKTVFNHIQTSRLHQKLVAFLSR